MVADLRTSGAASLAQLSADLKSMANGGLRRVLLKGIRDAARPLAAAAQVSARETLPRWGGLADVIGSTKIVVRTRTAGRTVGVRITDPAHRRTRDMDRGEVRHPVFGNRKAWVTEQIKPGWFTRPMEEGSPHVRVAIVRVIDDVGRRLHG